MKITEFYNTDYVDYASYSNLRMIASCIDGQKNAARKVLHTILSKNIKNEIKVSQLSSKMSEFTEYLHGDASGVIVNLAQNFSGSNNVPLLVREGNFGTRFSPSASAPRYIFTHGEDNLWKTFNREDNTNLIKQYFEGIEIEPKFFVPNLPIILLNGADGVSTGFAQKILPRNPKKVKNYVIDYLQGSLRAKKSNSLEPYYEGFKGSIEPGVSPKQWVIKGVIERIAANKFKITEVPVGYSLKGYIAILDELEEKKFIQSYVDKSENDNFLFEVRMSMKDLKDIDDEKLLDKMKLIKRVSENLTCIDENNKIVVFDRIEEIIEYFLNVKLKFMQKRKDSQLEKFDTELKLLKCKYFFIKGVFDGKIEVQNKKKSEIVAQLEDINNIITKDNNYDYLVNMPIHSLTKETFDKLKEDAKNKKAQYDELKPKTIEEIYLEDLT